MAGEQPQSEHYVAAFSFLGEIWSKVGNEQRATEAYREILKLNERSLLDVTPTLLTLFGLPIGADMDGRPLLQAFEQPPEVQYIPSWDADGACRRRARDDRRPAAGGRR